MNKKYILVDNKRRQAQKQDDKNIVLKKLLFYGAHNMLFYSLIEDFPGGSDGKASVYNAGDLGSIPGLGRSPGEGNGNPL